MEDWQGMSVFVTAAAAAFVTVAKCLRDLYRKDTAQQDQLDSLKAGLLKRGCLGAKPYIQTKDGKRTINDPAVYELFAPKRDALRKIRRELKKFLRRDPFDIELAFEIEKNHQDWLVTTVCPALGKHSYECLALACVIAEENGSGDNRPESWRP